MSRKYEELIQESPKVSQAVVAWELTLRQNLHKARESAGLEQWQLAAKLGWPLQKVQRIESASGELTFSELRHYLVATRCYIEFHLRGEKSLG